MENRNQSAYPVTIEDNGNASVTHLGLSKREYFSAMAMQGLIACPNIIASKEVIAEESVKQADALLKALETKSE